MEQKFKARDKVVHIEEQYDNDGHPFIMKIVSVMDWGQAIVEWPDGRLWIEDTKFLKPYTPVIGEEADGILHSLERDVQIIRHENVHPNNEYSEGWNAALILISGAIARKRAGK